MVETKTHKRAIGNDGFVTCTLHNDGCKTTVTVRNDVWEDYLKKNKLKDTN